MGGLPAIVAAGRLGYRPPMIDPYVQVKNAFSRYATGVTIVSCVPPGEDPLAITVNSFTSVSLEPTLVLWCLETKASVYDAFMAAPSYAVSVLAADQQAQSARFATPGQHGFAEGEGEIFKSGAPLLPGRLAGFDCDIVARHAAGDHVILVGEVHHFDWRPGAPLIYAGRQYLNGPEFSE